MEKPKTVAVKLDGTMIKSDGTEIKSSFFKFLELHPDDYSDIVYSAEEAKKIRGHLSHLSTGASAAIPLICGGIAVCPFTRNCPFVRLHHERKKIDADSKSPIPVGKQCLVEINLLNEWTRLYIREYDVDPENFTEFMLVRELAEIELMLWRLNNNISKPENAELVQDVIVGVDSQGNPLTRQEVNAFVEAKDRLQNRKSKLVKLMVGDRQEKYKRDAALKTRSDDDPSTNAARLRGELQKLLTNAKAVDLKIREAEGKVINAESAETTPEDTTPSLSPEDLINEG